MKHWLKAHHACYRAKKPQDTTISTTLIAFILFLLSSSHTVTVSEQDMQDHVNKTKRTRSTKFLSLFTRTHCCSKLRSPAHDIRTKIDISWPRIKNLFFVLVKPWPWIKKLIPTIYYPNLFPRFINSWPHRSNFFLRLESTKTREQVYGHDLVNQRNKLLYCAHDLLKNMGAN